MCPLNVALPKNHPAGCNTLSPSIRQLTLLIAADASLHFGELPVPPDGNADQGVLSAQWVWLGRID
jgi:hypothetical protein